MRSYAALIERKRIEYGDKFSPAALAPDFVTYYENQARIEVKFSTGETLRGRVGVTTGWRPVFLLIRRQSDSGSAWTLSREDRVTKIIAA